MNRKLRRTETKRVRPMQPQALATVHGIVDNAVRHHQARRLDEAASGFRRAVALKPDNAVAHLGLGNVLSELGQPDEAIASFRRAIAFKPDYPDPYNNLGALLLEQGQLDEAVACLGRAIELKPDYLDAHNNLGRKKLWDMR